MPVKAFVIEYTVCGESGVKGEKYPSQSTFPCLITIKEWVSCPSG